MCCKLRSFVKFLCNSLIILKAVNIESELQKYYQKGKSIDGRESYHPVVLFKMLLLQEEYLQPDHKFLSGN